VPIRELTSIECANLIATGGVGRVALCSHDGPRIYPVNFAVLEGVIVFRTSADGGLGLGLRNDPRIAFEVDQLEYQRQRGWSVVAEGTVEPVEDRDEIAGLNLRSHLIPWAEGSRNLLVRLTWQQLSGRRVGDW
jgi:uncharacterized protein